MEVAAKAAYPGECCGILLGKTAESSDSGEIEVLETREAPNLIRSVDVWKEDAWPLEQPSYD